MWMAEKWEGGILKDSLSFDTWLQILWAIEFNEKIQIYFENEVLKIYKL